MAFSDLSDYSNHETFVFDHCWEMFGMGTLLHKTI